MDNPQRVPASKSEGGAARSLSVPFMARTVSRPQRSLWFAPVGFCALTLAAVAACSPLPGPSLDPMYLKPGTQRGEGSAPEPAPAATVAGKESARVEASAGGSGVWSGRYQDSRGAGQLTFSIVRGASTISGTWRLRTGGGGPVTGILGTEGQRWQLRMENTGPECPAVFEGSMEVSQGVLIGAYHGRDCEGPVTDGRLELRPR